MIGVETTRGRTKEVEPQKVQGPWGGLRARAKSQNTKEEKEKRVGLSGECKA